MKLEISYKKKNGKTQSIWRLSNMLLNKKWVNDKIKEEIKKYLETNENENRDTKIYGTQQNQS